MNKPLLPAGCYDLLPSDARHENSIVQTLLDTFEAYGYDQVSPPLLEYAETLLAGRGAALGNQVFRIMDPNAHKIMGIRADMTLQLARIAATRMQTVPRPLRLCYAGHVLRMQGSSFKRDRQLRQAGLELIGATSPQADAEVIVIAALALYKLGMARITIDLNIPGITSQLLAEDVLDSTELNDVLDSVAHKDVAAIGGYNLRHKDLIIACIESAGPAPEAFAYLKDIPFPAAIRRQLDALQTIHSLLSARLGSAAVISIDLAGSNGFEYHSGITFSFFHTDSAEEIGNGGRYATLQSAHTSEEATGFTLYVDTLRRLLPKPGAKPRIYITGDVTADEVQKLQQQGFTVTLALPEYGHSDEEARRQRCTHIYKDGKAVTL